MLKKLSLVLGLVPLLLFSSTMIQAQQFLTMPACAFRPWDEDATHTYYWDYAFADSDSVGGTFHAPIYLPQDATILSVTFSYSDTNVSYNLDFYVSRTNLYTGLYQYIFSGSSSGSAGLGSVTDSTLNDGSRVVKNNSFHYVAMIYVPPAAVGDSLRFYTLKIKYQ